MLDVDARLSRWMRDRFGVAHRDELRLLGLSDEQIDHRCRRGVLERVHPAVYRHAAAALGPHSAIRAAVLAAGPVAWASGRSAMVLYGCRGQWDGRPEVTVLDHDHVELAGVAVRCIDRIAPEDRRHRFGIPVLAPPLALLLLGASSSPRRVHVAVHDLVHQRLTTRGHLLHALSRYGGRGRRGTVAFRAAIASLDADGRGSQTNLELDVALLLRAQGLPEPHLQYPIEDGDGRKRKLDVAYPGHKLDVETDGDRWHLNAYDRAADRQRDAALQAIGWEVQRYGSADVHIAPAPMLAAIRRSLAA